MTLEELAARCGSTREARGSLSNEIYEVVGIRPDRGHPAYPAYHFTGSIDAAILLVPDGYSYGAGQDNIVPGPEGWAWVTNKDDFSLERAATPALALCAAALRARASAERNAGSIAGLGDSHDRA